MLVTIIGYGCTNQVMEEEEGNIGNPRVKGWNLTIHNVAKLEKKSKQKGEKDANTMWEEMAHCIAEAVLRVVRVPRWGGGKLRELRPCSFQWEIWGVGWVSVGKGGKEWVRVGKSGIFF